MPTSHSLTPDRPSNPEVENENQRPSKGVDHGASDGQAPRPATEPAGAKGSSDSPKTQTDPGSGET
jgi:hypothetical protein